MLNQDALPEADELLLPGSRNSRIIYWAIIVMIMAGICSLPFVIIDITAQADGMIRPSLERTPIKSMVSGLIDSLHFRDGDFVEEGTLIATISNNTTSSRLISLTAELRQKQAWIHDLDLLLQTDSITSAILSSVVTPFYRHAVNRYLFESADRFASVKKVDKEMRTTTVLLNERVVSQKEFDDKSTEASKQSLAYQAFRNQQLETWQSDLERISSEIILLESNINQLKDEQSKFQIRAPVSGTLMGLKTKFPGSMIEPAGTLCEVSPEGELIAECYLMTQHIAFVRPGQPVTFRVEAFDQNYFSSLTGNVTSVDNDFTIANNKPIYTVRCKLNNQTLSLKNKYQGQLKKGLAVQARFIIAKRKLSDLLFDKISDWLNPIRG